MVGWMETKAKSVRCDCDTIAMGAFWVAWLASRFQHRRARYRWLVPGGPQLPEASSKAKAKAKLLSGLLHHSPHPESESATQFALTSSALPAARRLSRPRRCSAHEHHRSQSQPRRFLNRQVTNAIPALQGSLVHGR